MTEQAIRSLVLDLLKQVAPDTNPQELNHDDNKREKLGIDSFDALQFLVALEEKTGVEIPEDDYGKTTTLDAIVDYLSGKVK